MSWLVVITSSNIPANGARNDDDVANIAVGTRPALMPSMIVLWDSRITNCSCFLFDFLLYNNLQNVLNNYKEMQKLQNIMLAVVRGDKRNTDAKNINKNIKKVGLWSPLGPHGAHRVQGDL